MNNDNLQKWALIAEIVGGIAIVLSLIFVGLQIRQNTDSQLATSRQDMMEADLNILLGFMDHPQLIINTDATELPEIELARMRAYWLAMLRTREFAWFQYQNENMDEATWQSYFEPLFSTFRAGLALDYLKSGSYAGDPDFKAYLLDQFSRRSEAF